ncbi:MAG: KH domain-containing protein [Anaerolineales bacterium]
MKYLVDYIARSLVSDPTQVRVETYTRRNSVNIVLHVAREDMGRVIGKQGRVANAIRSLLRVMALRDDVRVNLDIE